MGGNRATNEPWGRVVLNDPTAVCRVSASKKRIYDIRANGRGCRGEYNRGNSRRKPNTYGFARHPPALQFLMDFVKANRSKIPILRGEIWRKTRKLLAAGRMRSTPFGYTKGTPLGGLRAPPAVTANSGWKTQTKGGGSSARRSANIHSFPR